MAKSGPGPGASVGNGARYQRSGGAIASSRNRPAGMPAPGASVLPTKKGATFTKQASVRKIRAY